MVNSPRQGASFQSHTMTVYLQHLDSTEHKRTRRWPSSHPIHSKMPPGYAHCLLFISHLLRTKCDLPVLLHTRRWDLQPVSLIIRSLWNLCHRCFMCWSTAAGEVKPATKRRLFNVKHIKNHQVSPCCSCYFDGLLCWRRAFHALLCCTHPKARAQISVWWPISRSVPHISLILLRDSSCIYISKIRGPSLHLCISGSLTFLWRWTPAWHKWAR